MEDIPQGFEWTPDLLAGVVPISAAASQLARRIRQARSTGRPIVITQKGRPTAVVLSVAQFDALRSLAQGAEHAS